MKYAVIAALLATTTSAASGCKPGIKAQVFEKKDCKGKGVPTTKYTSKEEIAESGECKPSKELKNEKGSDLWTLEKTKAQLKKDEEAQTEANALLKKNDDKVLMKSTYGGTGSMPKKFLEEKYAPIEKAYFTKEASKKVFDEYKSDKGSESSKIDAYVAAQTNWYKETLVTPQDADQKRDVKAAKDAADAAFKKIEVKDKDENTANRALIDKYVKDNTDEINLFDKACPDGDGSGDDTDKVNEANRRALGEYLVRSLAAHKADETFKASQGVVETNQKMVDAQTFASKTTCDAKKGVTVQVWQKKRDCKDDPSKTYTAKWDTCTQFGDNYYKITGATALKAAALAVAAFAGSQF